MLSCGNCDNQITRQDGIWRAAPDFTPAGFGSDRRDHLEALAANHFWFSPRSQLLETLLTRFTGDGLGAAVDLGCGTGEFLAVLAGRYRTVVGIDAYPESLEVARRQASTAVLVQANILNVPLAGTQFDLAMALDVLEHVEPHQFLAEARRLVVPGGWILVSVPAFPSLWSELDRAAGHRRRYRWTDLKAELEEAGWSPIHWTHYQCTLFPLIWITRRLRVDALQTLERRPPKLLGRFLGGINRLEVALLGNHRLRWGSSIICLARRHE